MDLTTGRRTMPFTRRTLLGLAQLLVGALVLLPLLGTNRCWIALKVVKVSNHVSKTTTNEGAKRKLEVEGNDPGPEAGDKAHRRVTVTNTTGSGVTIVYFQAPPGTSPSVAGTTGTVTQVGPDTYKVVLLIPPGESESFEVSYQVPGGSTGSQLTDTVTVTGDDGEAYTQTFVETVRPGSSQAPGHSPLPARVSREPGVPPGTLSPAPQANTYWLSGLWFYSTEGELDTTWCQSWVDLLQSEAFFVAARFPATRPAGADSRSTHVPFLFRPDLGIAPVFQLLNYTQTPPEMLSSPLELRPARVAFAENELPAAAGKRWMTLGVARSPKLACPANLTVPEHRWELFFLTPLAFPDDPAQGEGAELDLFFCYQGHNEPFFLTRLATASGLPVGRSAAGGSGVTWVGPFPVRVSASDPLVVTQQGFAVVQPGAVAAFPHTLSSRTGAGSFQLSATSRAGLTWGFYEDAAMQQPIQLPVQVGTPSTRDFWVAARVPAGHAAGPDTVVVTATNVASPAQTAWSSDQLWVGTWAPPQGWAQERWIQVASHADGLLGSRWRTDVGLQSTGPDPVRVELRLHAGAGVLTRQQVVDPGAQVLLQDLVGLLGHNGSGALQVVSDHPLRVTSRTYTLVASNATCTPSGTFGQSYPAVDPREGLAAGESAWLTQLTHNAAYRTNLAYTNAGTSNARLEVLLFDGAGGELARYPVNLAPGEWRQTNGPFQSQAGQTNLERGYARVNVLQGTGILVSASVVDNRTNDPTTMSPVRVAQGGHARAWMQVASHDTGANQTRWRTDLGCLNSGLAVANLQIRLHAAGGVVTSTTQVAPGAQSILRDVVGQLGHTGSAALEVVSDVPVWVSSRTYTELPANAACTPNGTFGQDYPPAGRWEPLAAGSGAWLTHLVQNPSYRTNIALTNTSGAQARVRVTLFDGVGAELAHYDVTLSPGQWSQENRAFLTRAGRNDIAGGYARVEVLEGTGVLASASVVDMVTNDPTTLPVQW